MLVSPAAVMSAKEYYDSAPGQRDQSPDSFWKSGSQQPPAPLRKGSRDDYILPGDPAFTLTNFPSSTFAGAGANINPNADGAALSPPPKPIPTPMPHDHHDAMRSPPPPQSPDGSQVTDESDDSLVHVRLPGSHSHSQPHSKPPPPSAPRPRTPVSNPRRSDSLSLTQSNIQQLNAGHGTSSIVTPLRGSYSHFTSPSSSRKRLRAKELSTHGKDTLIQMLVKQEMSTDDSRKLLRGALDKLEQYKLDLLEANNHCRRLERACQKLTDDRMLVHTQATETMGKAQQQALAAQQELAVCKLRLEHTDQALATAHADLRQAKLQMSTSNLETERLRSELHHLREQSNVREAREQGRKQGYDEGVQQGRVHARQITHSGEPASAAAHPSNTSAADTSVLVGEGGAFIEEANTTRQSGAPSGSNQGPVRSSSRASTSSSLTSRDPRVLKASFDSALSQARQETELRLQRELENQLNAERHRLQLLNLEHEQALERASRDQSDQLQKLLAETQKQTQDQMQELKDMQRRLQDELRKEKERVERVRDERNQERERREREERERRREREERELERQQLTSQKARLAEERERERRETAQKDAERDRLVAEANATAAQAIQAASAASAAAAAASASTAVGGTNTRPSSMSSNSNSNSDHEQSSSNLRSFGAAPIPPLPYIPMPRPPMDMPVPSVGQPLTVVPPTMAMPEASITPSSLVNTRPPSRSTQQPALPQTVPARQGTAGGRNRRSSIESQSSISTVAGAFDSLVSFPHAVPSAAFSAGRASSSSSAGGGGGRTSSAGGGNGRGGASASIYGRPYNGGSRDGPYGIPEREKERPRDMLSDIPEDASDRSALSPPASSSRRVHPSAPMVVPPPPVLNTPAQSGPAPAAGGASNGRYQAHQQQPPSWYANPTAGKGESSDDDGGPVIPTIQVDAGDADRDNWRSGEHEDDRPVNPSLLNPRGPGANLRRSDSANSGRPSITSNSSYEIVVEPPSNPTSPREERRDPHSDPSGTEGYHNQPVIPGQYLSPAHATIPIPPVQVPIQPVRNSNERQQRKRTRTQTSSSSSSRGWGSAAGGRDDENPTTEPSSPVIPSSETQSLPPGFVPRTFTPHAAPSPSLPPVTTVSEGLPPGFVPQSITDAVTGITTPLMGMPSALPNIGGGAGGGASKSGSSGHGSGGGGSTSTSTSRRASVYGNPNAGGDDGDEPEIHGGAPDWSGAGWGSSAPASGSNTNDNKPAFSPYLASSSSLAGPPVIPKIAGWGNDSNLDPQQQAFGSAGASANASRRNTPGSHTRSIYGTPSALGGSRNLPSGPQTPAGGVYQNPLRQADDVEGEGDGDADDLVARNTRINATAPLPGGKKKKKKGGR